MLLFVEDFFLISVLQYFKKCSLRILRDELKEAQWCQSGGRFKNFIIIIEV